MKSNQLAFLGGKPIFSGKIPDYYSFGPEEKRAVARVMDRGVISAFLGHAGEGFLGGVEVQQFEASMCRIFKTQYAVSFNSATTALQAAVAAAGVGPGDEVITSPYTMSATASAILLNNAIPIFADIDPETFSLDYRSIEARISPKTKAILVVNIFGGSTDFDKILPIARKHKLVVIEDNAQSIGAMHRGRYLGTIGDIGVFSFNVHKILQSGEGGVLVTNNKNFALRAQLVRNHGEVVVDDLVASGEKFQPIVGSNYRLSELHAAVALAQLRKMNKLIRSRVALAEYLTKQLQQFSWLRTASLVPESTHVYYVYPITFLSKQIGITRNTFVHAMTAEGFALHEGYVPPLYWMQVYQKRQIFPRSQFPFVSKEHDTNVHYPRGLCPVAERLYSEEFVYAVFCYPPITRRYIDLFIQALRKIETHRDALVTYEFKNKK